MLRRHQHRLNQKTDFVNLMPKCFGEFEPFITYCRNNNGNIDIAIRFGVPFGIGTKHQHLRFMYKMP